MIILLLITAVLVLVGRFTVPGHGISWPGSYEALAHVWSGAVMMLFSVWLFQIVVTADMAHTGLGLLLLLTTVETVAFIHGVYTGKFKLWKE